jgi:hypothetical protein
MIDKIIRDVMETRLLTVTSYQPVQMTRLCLEIADDVLRTVCKENYDRFEVTEIYFALRISILRHLTAIVRHKLSRACCFSPKAIRDALSYIYIKE